jgi:TatD DNase family protein
MIDTHIHLNHIKIKNVDEAINNARLAGVKKMVVVGFDYLSSKKAIQLSEQYSEVYAAIGCHPVDYKTYDLDFQKWIIENIKHKKVVALGEIGLDYYWIKEAKEREIQKSVFFSQLEIAKKYSIPIIIHSRESNEDVIDIIMSPDYINKIVGIMHSFSGTPEQAKTITNHGYYIGIGGVVTYKNGQSMQKTIQVLGISKVVLETDAPFLTPEPFRRETNESKYLPLIAEKISVLTKIDYKEVIRVTSRNAAQILPGLENNEI